MSNNSKRNNHGPMREVQKPKDFSNSIRRLISSLKEFRVLLYASIILAALASVLSLISPNKLSLLTDEISKGISIDMDKVELITKDIQSDMESIPLVLGTDMNDSYYNGIFISREDKIMASTILGSIENKDYSKISEMPTSIKKAIFKDSTIDNVFVSGNDKIEFIDKMSKSDYSNVNSVYKTIDSLPKSIQSIINPKMNMNRIKKISLFLASLYILSAIFNYIEGLSMIKVANLYAKKLRNSISLKINKLPLKYFDHNLSGDVLSRVTNDVDTIAQSLNNSLSTLVSSITLFIGSIIMMFVTNYIMAITAIISSLIGFVFMFIILNKSQKYFALRQKNLGKLNGYIEEIYSGLNVVKSCNAKDETRSEFDRLNDNLYDCNRRSQFLSGLMGPIMGFIGNFGYVAVCIVGALLASNDIISFGVIVAFIVYVRLFTNPLSQMAQAMTSIQTATAASERVFEFLDEEEMSSENDITGFLDKKNVKGNIEFRNVKFGYDKDRVIINDFTAKVKAGQKVAIVGPTGAGKTTMVNLLMKFYDITDGDILIDGTSIKNLKRSNIHSLFTMVLQDTWLFNGTIKENIVYNHRNVSNKRVQEVCKLVGIDHFIKTLPNGYDSILSDNDSVSSGQRQLITIARGMISDSPFLILDEATSNVDTRTEELVQKAMDKLMDNKTSFIIAHRLSTIRNADLILVMNNGNIIEQGNHDELMKKNGFYASLYNSQFEKIGE